MTTIDQQAKYLLLDKWCEKHNKPIIKESEFCEDCLKEIEKQAIDLAICTNKSLEETINNLKKSIQGSNEEWDSIPPKINIPKEQKRRYRFEENKTFRQKWRDK